MESTAIKLIEGFFNNPSFEKLIIGALSILVFAVFKWRYIEDYFSYRSLKRYERLISLATDSSLKKSLTIKKDHEIFFKEVGIRQVDLAKKVMQLLNHQSLILYRRDLDYYRYKFYLKDFKLYLKSLNWWEVCWVFVLKVITKLCGFLAIFTFCCAIFILIVSISSGHLGTVKQNLISISMFLGLAIFFFIMLISYLKSSPVNNEKGMHELLEEFNKLQ